MTLVEQYDAAVASNTIRNDPIQRMVVTEFERVREGLNQPLRKWFDFRPKKLTQGLYLHGPVGVGKTWLVDLFYQSVTQPHKARFHFHHFMQEIDSQLRCLQGQKDPLRRIAHDLSKSVRLLCLDEFLVHHVADAMILSELLQALFEHDVVLVAATNTSPDDLYLNGVRRERFLPAIDLIKQHCEVLALTQDHDYRLGREALFQAYLSPLDDLAKNTLIKQFETIVTNPIDHVELTVQNRPIVSVKCGERAVWFAFDVICNMPRCQLDYLEIAERFDTVFLSDIPVLTQNDTTQVILLIYLIDVMYDQGIRLVVSAAVPPDELYTQGPMIKSFQRTLSRLQEMQSVDYLKRHQRRHLSHFVDEKDLNIV